MDTKIKTSSGAPNMVREQIERFKSISQVKLVLIIITLFLVFSGQKIFAQGVGISETTIVPHASAILELSHTAGTFKGFLTPRMTEAERNTIAVDPTAEGLIIYNTTTNKLNIYDGTVWRVLFSGNFGVNSVTGTADRITVSENAPDPVIDIAATYIGQNTITTLGTITTGIWNGTIIAIANGGTNSGAALAGSSIMISNGASIVQGAAGTTTTVLHGNAAGAPTYGQIVNADIAVDAVTSDKILDDEIVDADVNTAAAIAGTKISPDFGAQNIVTTGTLAAGATTVTGNIAVSGTVDGRDIALDGTNQDALQTLSGVAAGDTDLGLFTGTTITDNTTVKTALQELETATETGLAQDLTDAYTNGNDLVTSALEGDLIFSGTETVQITTTGGLIANTVDINAGTIDATTIGATTPATASVTNLTATGTVNLGADAIQAAEIQDGAVTSAKILDANVTYAKIQDVSATNTVLGRVTAGAGVVEEISTTGTGNVVRATSPTLVTPTLGAASATSIAATGNVSGDQLISTIANGTAPLIVTSTTPVTNLSIGGNAATATALANTRSIYGNNFDGTADLTQVIASTYGGTGNGFTKFTGPITAEKTFTLPNASATILTNNSAVTIPQGGTGATTKTAAFDALSPMSAQGDIIYGAASGTGTRLAKGTAGQVLVMNAGATAPEWNGGGLTATATLDFPSTTQRTSQDLTIAVTGATAGDVVILGIPSSSNNANSNYSAWVSGVDEVTVRFNNYGVGSIDPASGTFRVTVLKY